MAHGEESDEEDVDKHHRRISRSESHRTRSLSPDALGPRVLSVRIRSAPFIQRFKQPNHIHKYNGETDPELWLEDYHLACMAGARRTRTLSSATCPCTLQMQRGIGWNALQRTKSIPGQI